MTAAVHRLMALNNMKTQNLSPDLLRDFSVEQLTAAFERMKLSDFPYELGVGTTALQKAMLIHEGFLPTLRSLLELGMSAAQVQSLMQTAETLEIPFFELSAEQIFSIQTLNLLSDILRMQYFRCFGERGLQEPHRSILLDNIQHLGRQREVTFTSMSESQRALLWKPYFADYVNAFPAHLNAALNVLPQNEALQRLMELLFEKKVTLNLLPEHWHALRHTTQRDVDLFGTLLTLLPEREAANGHFITRWSENGCQTYDLQQMIRLLPQMSAEKVHELFFSLLSYVAGLYGKQLSGLALDSLSHTQSRVLIYAIAKGQKAFLRLVKEHFELFKEISDNSMLFSSAFYERIQLNSMNRQNLSDCKHVPAEKLTLDALPETFFTFAELKTLAYAPEHYAKLYRRLMDQGVDRRLLLLRQLLRHRLLSCTLGEDQLDELAARLKEKPFDRWFSEDMGHINGLRKEDAVCLLSCWSQLRRFIHDMHTSDEACYAIRNRMVLGDYTFWADARGNMVALDQDWQEVCKEFQFTDKFIEANADGVLRFISQEGAAIANAYLNHEMSGHESLRRIVQAEIMGRLQELKYHEDDLTRELNLMISSDQKKVWMNNTVMSQDNFSVCEHDDFYTTMQIGEIPTQTCLSYHRGAQSGCLLACFDANKKILMAYRNGKPVARSMIRLTKGGFFTDKQQSKLEFVDLQDSEGDSGCERTILFLERMYTNGLNGDAQRKVAELFIALLKEKALKLDAVLVVSPEAVHVYDDTRHPPKGFIHTRFSLYISRSKAGAQYLDSLSGANTVSNECSYRSGIFYVLQDAK